MKYAPKKVFILENGKYKEITYSELQKLEQSDKSYAEKFFLPLYGMLMEVTAETYKAYYKDQRRQKYIDERSLLNGDVSYDALLWTRTKLSVRKFLRIQRRMWKQRS